MCAEDGFQKRDYFLNNLSILIVKEILMFFWKLYIRKYIFSYIFIFSSLKGKRF